jgi:large subunit ribosomal protein L23
MDVRQVIQKLQLTEKATALQESANKYFFRVSTRANKMEIKQAVEAQFGVQVTSVNTMRYQGKRKRERTVKLGRRSDWKRAVVTLREGSTIDMV